MERSPTSTRQRRVDVGLWALAVVLGTLTLLFSLGVSPPGASSFSGADKAGHGATYFATVFVFLLAAVWRPGRGPGPLPNASLTIALGAIAVGIAVEALQELATTTRHADALDVAAEVVGSLGAWALHRWARRRSVRV